MKNLIIAGAFIGVLFATDYLQLHGYAKWIGLVYVVFGSLYFIRYIIKAVRRG